MKRVIVILMIALIFVGVANADESALIDFSCYSFDELTQIKADLMEEISKRPEGEKTTLESGVYKIGEDLVAGMYSFKFSQNSDGDESVAKYYVYENESMYKYDIDRMWLGDMPRLEGFLKGNYKNVINLYPGEVLRLSFNDAEIERIGDVPNRDSNYEAPSGTKIPKGEYTIGEEIPAGTYQIYYNGESTARVRIFQDSEEASSRLNRGKQIILGESNPEGMITMDEGNVIRVEYTPIIMAKSSGFSFD